MNIAATGTDEVPGPNSGPLHFSPQAQSPVGQRVEEELPTCPVLQGVNGHLDSAWKGVLGTFFAEDRLAVDS